MDAQVELIARLVGGMVDSPDEIVIAPTDSEDLSFVKWWVAVDSSDFGKLVGKRSTHRIALGLIISLMGKKHNAIWRLQIEYPDADRVNKPRIPRAETFDPLPTLALLHQTIAAIAEEPAHVTVTQAMEFVDAVIVVTMKIAPRTRADEALLQETFEVSGENLTPLDALGTIFRAIGRQLGVAIKVEVAT